MVKILTLNTKDAKSALYPIGEEVLDTVMDSAVAGFVLRNLHQKDPATYEHSERVAKFAVAIGQAMGFMQEDLERLRLSALLHDIGKIAVNLAILSKPKKLEKHEMATPIHPHSLGNAESLRGPGAMGGAGG